MSVIERERETVRVKSACSKKKRETEIRLQSTIGR